MDIKEEFKRRKKRQIFAAIPVFIVIAPMVLMDKDSKYFLGIPVAYLSVFSVALVVCVLIFSLKNWRCPSCNAYLGKRINQHFCSSCGTQLQ